MLNNLDRRADDAVRLSESTDLEITQEIERLRDHVRSFEQDHARLSTDDTRTSIEDMLSEARAAQADLSGSTAPMQLRDDVNVIVGMLTEMRDANMPVGTTGYGPAVPGVDYGHPAYAAPGTSDLARALDSRVARASDLAAEAAGGDFANRIAQFRDRLRDFDDRAAGMTAEDRHEAVDRLLKDAQQTQRDLAGHHVSAPLMDEWNSVVDLLVQLKDRS
jgi:hypothetical protein